MTSALISAADLADRLSDPDLRIVDASWHLDGHDARADFADRHIPGAVFLDLDVVSDGDSPLPHTLPSPAAFAASAGVLGLSDRDSIVVYDTAGLFSAARVWWMLKIMGARDVRVLDGGLPAWTARGLPLETGAPERPSFSVFSPRFDSDAVVGLDQVRAALGGETQVLDARGAGRFRGETAEPRPGVRSGHMPGALNLPYGALLNADGTMKRGPALEAAFTDAGMDLDRPAITTCGSGVTAAILTLGLHELGRTSRLYDGSWAEWGAPEGGPVQTG
ncbi:3-mercaptopyruvate sulfurtransferase [Brevundimonas sp. M20]|uniref:3-mercaptopyruvate sulfurtransferase n=1 Tax=Brevundimonas sp. M20 TaxID=2591463 RepID=UPI0011472386|nr:3-mercaptopyruvate sulfurtransferase [Brevundimonas sp. M20]QDH73575.1 3-mercaptopyruvate sulfurtransferase [Brevundimonas sp. M20]